MNSDAKIAVTAICAAILKGFDQVSASIAATQGRKTEFINNATAAKKARELVKDVVYEYAAEIGREKYGATD